MSQFADLIEAGEALEAKELSAAELVQQALDAGDSWDPDIGIFVSRQAEQALTAAKAVDDARVRGEELGALAGIPLGIKDILATDGSATTAQSLILDPAWGGQGDGPAVARLRREGAVFVGKTTTMEFATGAPDPEKPFPVPRNPWSTARWAGGSSSGTAGGIAVGAFLAGLGTDTAGSIRTPSAYCGISGLMPTFGRVPKSGCVPLGYSLDHIGPMGRSARDLALLLGILAGPDATDPTCADEPVADYPAALTGRLDGVRIGVDDLSRFTGAEADPETAPALRAAAAVLEQAGARIVPIQLPYYEEVLISALVTMRGESLAYHRNDLSARWDDYFRNTRGVVSSGAYYSAADFVQAQRVRRLGQRAVGRLFETVDLVLTPTASVGAPALDGLVRVPTSEAFRVGHTPYWNVTGNPAASVPMGFSADGLPLGLQIAGPWFAEAAVLRAADAFQRGTAWHRMRPPEPSGPPAPLQGRPTAEAEESAEVAEVAEAARAGMPSARQLLARQHLVPHSEELPYLERAALAARHDADRLYALTEAALEEPGLIFHARP